MRRRAVLVVALAGLALPACKPASPPPPPPPGAKRIVQPADPAHVDAAVSDTLREMARLGLKPGEVGLWRVPAETRFEDVTAYYDGRLAGWRRDDRMPNRTKAARSAAWRSNARSFAVSLISHPGGVSGPAPYQVLAVVQPSGKP